MNKAILVGRLGKDPEFKNVGEKQTAMAKFSMATKKRGEGSEWHNIVVWGKSAEICNNYLNKGSLIAIEGEITTRSWESDSGEKKYITEIMAYNVEMLGKKDDSEKKGGGFESKEDKIPF